MSNLRFEKVTVLPTPLTANTFYFLLFNNRVSIYITNSDGSIAYQQIDTADVASLVETIISLMIDQPSGIAGISALGKLSPSVTATAFDGQNGTILTSNQLIWDDLLAPIVVKGSGANSPTFGTVFGNMQGYLFSPNTMQQEWVDFHVKHDIALNTKLYPHVHWLPTTSASGTVIWGFEYTIAKGHDQEEFSTTTQTVYVTFTIEAGGKIRRHLVSEVSDTDAILSDKIEPDSFVKMRVFRDAANDTYPDPVHAWQVDIHYQRARLGTINKAPNFFA